MNQLAMLKRFTAAVEGVEKILADLQARSARTSPLMPEETVKQETVASAATENLIKETNEKLILLLTEIYAMQMDNRLIRTVEQRIQQMDKQIQEISSTSTSISKQTANIATLLAEVKKLPPLIAASKQKPAASSRQAVTVWAAAIAVVCALATTWTLKRPTQLVAEKNQLQTERDTLNKQVEIIDKMFNSLSSEEQKEFQNWVRRSAQPTP